MAVYVINDVGRWLHPYEAGSDLFFVGPNAREVCAAGKLGCCVFPVVTCSETETELVEEFIQTLANSGMSADYIYCAAMRYQRRTHLLEVPSLGVSVLVQKMKELGYAGGRILISHCCNEMGALELMRQLRQVFGSIDVRITSGGEGEPLLVGVVC